MSGGLQSRMKRETWRTPITSLFSIQRWAGGQGQTKAEQGLCSFTWAASLSVCRLGEADQRDDTGKSMAV